MVLVMFCTGLHLNDSRCSVDVHHDNRGVSGHVSWAQNFSITLDQNVIHLLQNHVVEVSKLQIFLDDAKKKKYRNFAADKGEPT